MQSKRNIILWALYDFANSIVSIVFFFYFAQWIVVEKGIADIYLNLTFSISAVLLLFTVPISGLLLDRFFRRITGLRISTVCTAVFYLICSLLAIADYGIGSLIFFTLGLYFYLLTFTFYTPLLNDISNPEKRGWVSGIGIAANYLGQFIGLLIVLPFSNQTWSLFQASPRVETLLPAILIFCLLSLPMLIFFHEPKKPKQTLKLHREIKELVSKTKTVFLYPSVFLFLLSYFFFNDAVLTAANNFPIFLEQVWGVSDTIKTYILIGILITSAIGGLVAGLIADRFGHKKTLLWLTGGWIIILPLIGFLENFTWFVVATSCMGLWFGANWTVSRSVMSYLAPPQEHNLTFAYFGLVERASSFAGPIVWGLVLSGLTSIGSDRYRFATLAVTAFIIFGFLALRKVRSDLV